MVKKIASLTASIIIMLCLGGIYSWSVVGKELIANFQYTSLQTQLIFGTVIFTFTFLMIFTGPLMKRIGARANSILSACFLTLSYLLTSHFGANFWMLLISFGFIGGIAISFGYVASLSTGIRVFPKHKGLFAGIVVAGYGAGAIILTNIMQFLLLKGYEILEILKYVGFLYGAIVFLAALFIFKNEPQVSIKNDNVGKISLPELLKHKSFWALSLGILFGTLPGLILIGKIKEIGVYASHSDTLAAEAIIFLSIGSMSGRVIWGFLNDHFKQRLIAISLLVSIVISAPLLAITTNHITTFWVASFFLGFTYGGSLSIYPSQTASIFGSNRINEVYPYILFAHGIAAAIGPAIGGLLIDKFESYTPVYILSFCGALIGLIAYLLLSTQKELQLAGRKN